jgi:hypothetical protein
VRPDAGAATVCDRELQRIQLNDVRPTQSDDAQPKYITIKQVNNIQARDMYIYCCFLNSKHSFQFVEFKESTAVLVN